MEFKKLDIEDVVLITPRKFHDERGYFMESHRQDLFNIHITPKKFVQDNFVTSKKNVIRGLHFQIKYPQGKLVRCLSGEIFDVAVDMRKDSKTYGHWVGERLSEDNGCALWIPEGFAHGYSVLTDDVKVLYKCTDVFHPNDESGIIWNDYNLNINWKINEEDAIISEKDNQLHPFVQTDEIRLT
tara:strand:- start:1341 stop:1892 length:552 start_codon:yes stop_codon:yes gene_type:complete